MGPGVLSVFQSFGFFSFKFLFIQVKLLPFTSLQDSSQHLGETLRRNCKFSKVL